MPEGVETGSSPRTAASHSAGSVWLRKPFQPAPALPALPWPGPPDPRPPAPPEQDSRNEVPHWCHCFWVFLGSSDRRPLSALRKLGWSTWAFPGRFPQEGKEFAESKGLLFMETSAKLNHQVTEAFGAIGE